MRYASIRDLDVTNGQDVGMALFVQGCPLHCEGCFNKSTWNPNAGHEWTSNIENEFISLAGRDYIKRVSILGGEPMAEYNKNDVTKLILKLRGKYGSRIKIWLYTGYTFEELMLENSMLDDDEWNIIATLVDVIVDGRYVADKRDISLSYRGSSNQRVIDCKKSFKNKEVVLLEGIDNYEEKIQ